MRSLKRRFKKIAEKHPTWSSYVCFAETVKGQNFNRQSIHRWFQKLVEKDDFDRSDKKEILLCLDNLNTCEDDKKQS